MAPNAATAKGVFAQAHGGAESLAVNAAAGGRGGLIQGGEPFRASA